jgi:ankyrin repeat protein
MMKYQMMRRLSMPWLSLLLFPVLSAGPLRAQAPDPPSSPEVRLASAIDAGDDAAAEALIRAGADVSARASGMAPFYRAARQGHLAIARRLLDAGAAFDERDPVRGTTPLDAAIFFGHAAFAEWLVGLGADLEESGPIGFAAFDWALEAERPEMIELVLGWLADDPPPPASEEQASLRLIGAVLQDDGAKVRRLVADGVDPNAYSRTGYSALALAARWNRAALVSVLIDAGSDPSAGDSELDEASALSQAARGGHTEIGRDLIRRGADIDKRNGRGMTALFLATLYARGDFITMLLEGGADPFVRARDANPGIDDYAAFD